MTAMPTTSAKARSSPRPTRPCEATSFGINAVDDNFEGGLSASALHEVAPESPALFAAADERETGFAPEVIEREVILRPLGRTDRAADGRTLGCLRRKPTCIVERRVRRFMEGCTARSVHISHNPV
ncbi:MAG TPA: hypothetical protein VF638_06975 [Sphingomonas sp.]